MKKLTDEVTPLIGALVIGIMLLCITDAFFTLTILKHGGNEINPFMDMCIKIDNKFFFVVKYTITAVCSLAIAVHGYERIFKFFRGYHVLLLVLILYTTLVLYELIIMQKYMHIF